MDEKKYVLVEGLNEVVFPHEAANVCEVIREVEKAWKEGQACDVTAHPLLRHEVSAILDTLFGEQVDWAFCRGDLPPYNWTGDEGDWCMKSMFLYPLSKEPRVSREEWNDRTPEEEVRKGAQDGVCVSIDDPFEDAAIGLLVVLDREIDAGNRAQWNEEPKLRAYNNKQSDLAIHFLDEHVLLIRPVHAI